MDPPLKYLALKTAANPEGKMCWEPRRGSLAVAAATVVALGPKDAQKGALFLQDWWQHIPSRAARIFEGVGHGVFDVEQQSLIMDRNQIDIHRMINK